MAWDETAGSHVSNEVKEREVEKNGILGMRASSSEERGSKAIRVKLKTDCGIGNETEIILRTVQGLNVTNTPIFFSCKCDQIPGRNREPLTSQPS